MFCGCKERESEREKKTKILKKDFVRIKRVCNFAARFFESKAWENDKVKRLKNRKIFQKIFGD
jgi:phosphoenolpyruvate carboxylase